MAQAGEAAFPSMIVLVSVAFAGAPKVATRMPDAVPPGATFSLNVELVTVSWPSVWKIPPPCQAVETFPLNVLFTIVELPSDRSPPATSWLTLPAIVLRVILTVLLKNP